MTHLGERADGGNYDGRTGIGWLWALLSGERGEYELALRNTRGREYPAALEH